MHEWGIDKLQITVSGPWRTYLSDGFEFFQLRLTDHLNRWLGAPERARSGVSVETLSGTPLTVASIQVKASRCGNREGQVTVAIKANPTLTLSSLLLRYGNSPDFRATIFLLDAWTFFQKPPVELRLAGSLDGNENYLPEHPSARAALGNDPFLAFMPIYLSHLRDLVGMILAEGAHEISFEHGEQVFGSAATGEVRLNWAAANVPQIETYFERFHSRAVSAVRAAAVAILDGDQLNDLTMYPGPHTLARAADRLTVGTNLTVDRRFDLAVYAKTETRVRFEVRRLRRGRYSAVAPSDQFASTSRLDAHLLHIIFTVGRADAERRVQWINLFQVFDEPDEPSLGDLVELLSSISRAAGSADGFHRLISALLVDGGVSAGGATDIPDGTIRQLVRVGVLENKPLRAGRRSTDHLPRYQLTADYRWLRQSLLSALAPNTHDGAQPSG
ncbi:hypothetical protein DBR17_08515 [Sphingomonas sp. HMWF008]|nr:hypothetical protein DBR17_08515 [Sphingomonas sp. HMWF008]